MHYKAFPSIFLAALLCACQGVNPSLDTARAMFPSIALRINYQPGVEYLQVSHGGHKAAMALGWRKADGPVVHEYWYSGQREMLHLLDGRMFSVMGMTQELRTQVPANPAAPSWQAIAEATQSKASGGALVWSRTRDVQPGYRYGVVEYITSRQIKPTPAQQAQLTRLTLAAETAMWFEDQVEGKAQDGQTWRYTEQFAVANNRVVYSLQCVGPDLCLRLQPLGVMKP